MSLLDSSTSSSSNSPAPKPIWLLLSLAIPTVMQMASYSVMQFVDAYMLSHINEDAATAAGNAGLFAFSAIGFGVGVMFLVNTLVSQAYGRGETTSCGRYLWQGIWFGLVFSLLILPLAFIGRPLFTAMGHEPELVAMENDFYTIALIGTIIKLAATAMGQFMLAINRPRIVLLAAFTAMVMNVPTNWALIFGHWGFPALGVRGSAWGTNIAAGTELLMLSCFIFAPAIRRKYGTLRIKPILADLKTLLKLGLPSGSQLVADILAWSLFSMWVMGQFGAKAMAANTFMFRFMIISFMPAFGISAAVTSLVGRHIGRREPDVAEQFAHLGFKVVAVYMIACGILFLVFRNHLMGLFSADPEVLAMGSTLLIFAAAYQFFDAMYINYVGALRGAGDTFVPAVATACLCWGITVAGGYAVAKLFPEWGIVGPWSVAMAYGIVLGCFIFMRFKAGRWKTIHLDHSPNPDKLPGFEVVGCMPLTDGSELAIATSRSEPTDK